MKLIEVLKGIRDFVIETKDDVEVELLDHKVDYSNCFLLHYINYHKIGPTGGLGVINWPLKPFIIPDGMNSSDAFKVLSYLIDRIEKNMDVQECSFKSVKYLDDALNLERFGFKRIEDMKNVIKPTSLYTVSGRLNAFKKSEYYNTYFEWYTEGVTKEEIEEIYRNIGMEFIDLKFSDEGKKLKLEQQGE